MEWEVRCTAKLQMDFLIFPLLFMYPKEDMSNRILGIKLFEIKNKVRH